MTPDPTDPTVPADAVGTGDHADPSNVIDPKLEASLVALAVAAAPPAPDHRDMYILIVGLIVGLAVSPWIMGRFMGEGSYRQWYFGGGEAYQQLLETQRKVKEKDEQLLERLVATGATKEAVDELRSNLFVEFEEASKAHKVAMAVAQHEHEQWLRGILFALMIAAVVVMFMEPLFEMTGSPGIFRRSLVTGRYALLAAWIALALGQPFALGGISWLFLALAIIIIVATAAGRALVAKPAASEA